jgi:hypothetical protein
MKISPTAAFAVIACAEVATARCFFWGWDYNKEEAKGWINDACRAKDGMFTGGFAPGETKMMCPKSKYGYEHPNTLFQVQNQNPNESFDLNDDDCYNSLLSEIEKCWAGGESAYSGWRFRLVFFSQF